MARDPEKGERKPLPAISISARRFWPDYLAERRRANEQYWRHLAYEERKASYRRLLAEAAQGRVSASFGDAVHGRRWDARKQQGGRTPHRPGH